MKTQNKPNRFNELEGLRGLAAVMVVFYHLVMAFYLQAFLGSGAAPVQHLKFEDNLYANPVMGLLSGTFAVGIFFVLSGFVLSIGFLQTGNAEIIKKLATKRYLRLMIPAFVSILICYLLLMLGLSNTQEAAAITGSTDLANAWAVVPNLWQAIIDGLYGVFVNGHASYNVVLWTMTIEFIGSFIVFSTLLMFAQSKYRWVVYAVLLLATLNTWFFGFIVGMTFADLLSKGYFEQQKRKLSHIVPLLALSLYFGGYPYGQNFEGTLYAPFSYLPAIGVDYRMIATGIGASLLVFAILWSVQLASFLQRKHVSVLGKYTFALYLTHLPIIYTFTTGMFIFFSQYFGYNSAVVLAVVCSIPLFAGAAILFEKYVDRRAIQVSSLFAAIYLGKQEIDVKKFIKQKIHKTKRLFVLRRREPTQPALDGELE